MSDSILDSHCHAWRVWPYPPLVPDETSRGTIGQLVYEMDRHGVEQALVVCAAIENNPDNVEYVSFARSRYPDRIHVVADLDCTWHETYHQAGSADRLRAMADRYELTGFTHYAGPDNDGWLASDEADQLLTAAGERGLLFSLAASPRWQEDLRALARRHPDVPILCHHLGGASATADPALLRTLIESVSCPNIFIKASGFHYASARSWDHPWPDAIGLFRQIFEAFGPERLCWASDFPASTRYTTYRQSLEAFRTHCPFLEPDDLAQILGGTLRRILTR